MSKPFPHDGTRLGKELQDLEESDPKVKAARARLEEVFEREAMDPEDRVKPENLRIEETLIEETGD